MSTTITVLDRSFTKHENKVSCDLQPTKNDEVTVVFTAEHGFVVLNKKFYTATPVEHLSIFGIPADKALRYEFGYACGQCNCRIVDVATGEVVPLIACRLQNEDAANWVGDDCFGR